MHQEDRLFSPIVHHNKHCAEFLVNGNGSFLTHWLSVAMITTATALVQYLNTQDLRLPIVTVVLLTTTWIILLAFKVKQESILVMSSVGVQMKIVRMFGQKSAKFYDIQQIDDVVINEAITMHQVSHYLTIVLRDTASTGQAKLVPLFQHCSLRLRDMMAIHGGVQRLLFHQPTTL